MQQKVGEGGRGKGVKEERKRETEQTLATTVPPTHAARAHAAKAKLLIW